MLRLTGTPRIVVEGRLAARLPDKVYCLVALLILRFNGAADRGIVASLLWEDGDGDAARANLRNLLSQLKRWQERTGTRLVHADTSRIWRAADCEITDLDLLLAARPAVGDDDLEAIDGLFEGDLLGGRGADLGIDLLAWLDEQSASLWERFVGLVLPAAAHGGGAGAERSLRRMLERMPLDERVERALLTNLSRQKSAEAVRAEYRRFAERLGRDGLEPELETRLLAGTLGVEFAQAMAPTAEARKPSRPGLPRVLILPPAASEGVKRSAERIAASLVDDVTFGLCRMRTFAVIAPYTARLISREGPEARRTVDADYVLFTRLLPGDGEGDYRFGFSLARALTGEILMGDQLRFSLGDLPVRHADITRLVARLVAGEIERTEQNTSRLTRSPTAYTYFLMGQERLRMVDLPDLRAARSAFRHALELEPDFAPAMSMTARTLSMEWIVLNRGDNELLVQARKMASRAVEHDPLDPGGYRELGNAALYSHDLDAALEHLKEARARAPHHADVLLDHADALAHNSRFHEAKRTIDEAMSLNPLAPDEYRWVAATIQFFLKDFRGALKLSLGMANPEPLGRVIAASAHLIGDKETASFWRGRVLDRHPGFRVSDWAGIVPMRSATDRQFYEDAMRSAGFP
ncbi:MAG: tetratricopeptide repeat protein [Devosia nanyangense]|uniref:Tetratricopeptide repeat protein n=1 Tax=Devosia nanyangense TaxID=1228055 RepID=A0A933L1W9_9HYPH|nr:tetratricopeptide repeat protein [Devosia nanyangense]